MKNLNSIIALASLALGEDKGENSKVGEILAANDSRFAAGNPQQELTNFATGFLERQNLEAELNLVCPAVAAPRRFSYRTAGDKADFLSESDDIRAIGSPFKRVQTSSGEETGKTQNKGLCVVLDKDEIVAGDEERWVTRLTTRLFRNELVRAYAGIVAAAATVAKVWDGKADPDADVADALQRGGDKRGIDGNLVVYANGAWLSRFRSFRVQNNAGGHASAAMKPADLRDLLMVDNVLVTRARKQNSETANDKTAILSGYVLTYFAEPNPTRDDASNIKRFVTPANGGGRVAVYREETAKTVTLSVEHYSKIIVTSTLGIEALSVTAQAAKG